MTTSAMIDTKLLQVPKTVVIVGLMGAGKTCIGSRLAERLGLAFVDADTEIEQAAGCAINDIFEFYGETAFRDGERRVIARLLASPVHVLATGGGAFMDTETRAAIARQSISIWLRADLDLLVSRVGRRDNRPLLKGRDRREVLKALIDERHPLYEGADITVDSAREAPDITVDRVLEALSGYLTGAGQGMEGVGS